MDPQSAAALGLIDAEWAAYSIALAVSVLRYHIRRTRLGSLQPDDWIHMAALAQVTAYVVTTSIDNQIPVADPGDEQTSARVLNYLFSIETAYHVLYWTSIFTSKAVFLALYKAIFGVSRLFLMLWYPTVALTVVLFIAAVISRFMILDTAPSGYTRTAFIGYGMNAPPANNETFMTAIAAVSIVCDVTPDVLLIIIPLLMISKSQLGAAKVQKIVPIILLAAITVAFSLVSWVIYFKYNPEAGTVETDVIVPPLFLDLEPVVTVIVTALQPVLLSAIGRQHSPDRTLLPSSVGTEGLRKHKDDSSSHTRSHIVSKPTYRNDMETAEVAVFGRTMAQEFRESKDCALSRRPQD